MGSGDNKNMNAQQHHGQKDNDTDCEHEHAEQALIRRCLQGEVNCFGDLVRHYEPMIRTMIGRMIKEPDLVDELAHQVFVQAYEKLAQFEGRAKFSTWLCQIALNQARDHLRKLCRTRKHPSLSISNLDLVSLTPEPLQQASDEQEAHILKMAIATLKPIERKLITLRYLQDYDYRAIAKLLHCTQDAAKVRSFRARARLKTQLNLMGLQQH
jgi:RNA polymerase sigma-70 factor (ECF subfamily)